MESVIINQGGGAMVLGLFNLAGDAHGRSEDALTTVVLARRVVATAGALAGSKRGRGNHQSFRYWLLMVGQNPTFFTLFHVARQLDASCSTVTGAFDYALGT